MEEVTLYRCQFLKREPIIMGADSFSEAIILLHRLPNYDEEELISISKFNDFKVFV